MSAYLVDTHVLLWAALDSPGLGERATALLSDEGNDLWFSAASIWEVAIKAALGTHDFVVDVPRFADLLADVGYHELPVNSAHAVRVTTLPLLHRDPFDRLLVAQAAVEGMTLLTGDARLSAYPGSIELV